jgi:hypothetical protein
MTIDISPEAVAELWEDYLEAARPDGGDNTGGIELYDIEGMNDAAHSMYEALRVLSAALVVSQAHSDRLINTCADKDQAIFELRAALTEMTKVADAHKGNADDNYKRWVIANAALTASKAETAAAYEVMAGMVESTAYTTNGEKRSLEPVSKALFGCDSHHATIASTIRALTPADSKAALDRMIADAEELGMSKAAGISDNCVSMARESLAKADGIGERIAWRSAIARAQIIRDYILAAIPKGGE